MFRKIVCILTVLVLAGGVSLAAKTPRLSKASNQNQTYDYSQAAGKGNFNEGFESSVFPPNGWSLSGTAGLWARTTDCSGYGTGAAAARADFYNNSAGVTQQLNTPTFFPASLAGDSLFFDHAYATYSGENDRLQIYTSTNGGTNWTSLILLNGGTAGPLNTGGTTTGYFVPTAGQWATKKYALPVGTNRVRFTAISAYGNCLYVDNIQVTGALPDHDASVTTINAPTGLVMVATDPQVVAKNMGSNTESFQVKIAIDSGGVAVYSDSQNVSGLAPGDTIQVTFGSWTPAPGNPYSVTAYSQLAGDQVTNNDTSRTTTNSFFSRRKVYVEDFTAQWCGYCPYVQDALQRLKGECGDSIIAVGVHPSTTSDSFYTAHSADIMNFYGNIGGYPTTVWDGVEQAVGGWTAVYDEALRPMFDKRKSIGSPFTISLAGNQAGNTGSITATIDYPGGVPISGNIKMVIIEESKYCVWPSATANPRCDSMAEFLRDMFPSSAGDAITVNNGANTKTINFTLNAGWNKNRLDFLVYINNMTTKEIYNASEIAYNDMTGVEGSPDPADAGLRTQLLPCHPNPAGGQVSFSYRLNSPGQVSLNIYDIAGRLVHSLVDEKQNAGAHTVTWNGANEGGQRLASGIYFYKLTAGGYSAVKKITILR
jgi:thiol-disulfide isomerase/thioredoxin